MLCEADAAAQGIFTGELHLTEGRYFQLKSPRAHIERSLGALTTDMSPSDFPSSFLQHRTILRSVLSVTLGAVLLGVLQEFP